MPPEFPPDILPIEDPDQMLAAAHEDEAQMIAMRDTPGSRIAFFVLIGLLVSGLILFLLWLFGVSPLSAKYPR
jgi:hypothetical protein